MGDLVKRRLEDPIRSGLSRCLELSFLDLETCRTNEERDRIAERIKDLTDAFNDSEKAQESIRDGEIRRNIDKLMREREMLIKSEEIGTKHQELKHDVIKMAGKAVGFGLLLFVYSQNTNKILKFEETGRLNSSVARDFKIGNLLPKFPGFRL